MQCLSCSILSFSACLGSSTTDRERTFRNPPLKLEKWPLFLFTVIFNWPWKLVRVSSWIVVQSLKTIFFSFSSVCSNCKYALHIILSIWNYMWIQNSAFTSHQVELMSEISRSAKTTLRLKHYFAVVSELFWKILWSANDMKSFTVL